jgi:hypothetical protein
MFSFLDKGKIEIELPKNAFSLGDKIDGKVFLELKKPQKAKKLKVCVYGYRVSVEHSKGKTTENRQQVYINEQILDQEKEYPANQRLEYPFELQCATSQDLVAFPAAVGKSGFWGTVGSRLNDMVAQMPITWEVEANLDVSGFDVKKSVRITVS